MNSSESIQFLVIRVVIMYIAILSALTFRDAAMAKTALVLGDKSSNIKERATTNPIPHIDTMGTIIFPLILIIMGSPLFFGWTKPLNYSRKIENSPKSLHMIGVVGLVSNFGLAFIIGILFSIIMGSPISSPSTENFEILTLLFFYIFVVNVIIGTLNLIPIPGSQGWNILAPHLSQNIREKAMQNSQIISIIFLAALVMGILSPIFQIVLSLFVFLSSFWL